jgi:hypothetical protein
VATVVENGPRLTPFHAEEEHIVFHFFSAYPHFPLTALCSSWLPWYLSIIPTGVHQARILHEREPHYRAADAAKQITQLLLLLFCFSFSFVLFVIFYALLRAGQRWDDQLH